MCLPMPRIGWILIALLASSAIACGSSVRTQAQPPDRPVPASTPRAELSARVDLKPASDCEEAFDLAMYTHRAIELIAWDDRVGVCSNRAVDIRYLSNDISHDGVVRLATEHARRVTVLPRKDAKDEIRK